MRTWLFAFLLAGSILCSTECLYIVLSCGPFWVTFWLFLETWLFYLVVSLLCAGVSFTLLPKIPLLRRIFQNFSQKFILILILYYLLSSAGLVLLVKADLHSGQEYLILALVALCNGFLFVLLAVLLKKILPDVTIRAALLSLISFLLIITVWVISDQHYSAIVTERSHHWDGKIPHLFLLIIDTARGDHFSSNGYQFTTTPNIDRLAKGGQQYSNAYSAATWTPPGHISIFTGKYPNQHANNGEPFMPDQLVSLSEILRDQGYYCMAVYNNLLAGRDNNLTQGFDRDYGFFQNTWVVPLPLRVWDKMIYRDSGSKGTFPRVLEVFRWMQRKGGHLYLFVNVAEPHAPYDIHKKYFSQCVDTLNQTHISNFELVQKLCNSMDVVIQDSSRFTGFDAGSYAYLRAAYDNELVAVDDYFGEFVQDLSVQGILNDILLVLTSDHGEFLGEHYTRSHPPLLFNPVLRIPLIFYYPQTIAPAVNLERVSNVDIFPTVLNFMGYSDMIPADIGGVDLWAGDDLEHRSIPSVSLNPKGACYSLIKDHYKLIINYDQNLKKYFHNDTLLFNLENDPQELINLCGVEPETVHRLAKELQNWITTTTVAPLEKIEISQQTITNLKALGYVQ